MKHVWNFSWPNFLRSKGTLINSDANEKHRLPLLINSEPEFNSGWTCLLVLLGLSSQKTRDLIRVNHWGKLPTADRSAKTLEAFINRIPKSHMHITNLMDTGCKGCILCSA